MTKDQILSIQGRELDALVAEKVMDLEIVPNGLKYEPRYYLPDYDRTYHRSVPNYSTDISAAWEVAECVQRNTLHFTVSKDATMMWVATFFAGSHFARATTAPEAICKAALLAVMGL